MTDLVYDPKRISGYAAELENIWLCCQAAIQQYQRAAAHCPYELMEDAAVSMQRAAANDKCDRLLSGMRQLVDILEIVSQLYARTDTLVEQSMEQLRSPKFAGPAVIGLHGALAYREVATRYDTDRAAVTLNTDLDIPDWLLEEIAKYTAEDNTGGAV